MYAHAYSNPVCAIIIYCRKMFSLYVVKTFINICVIINATLIWDVGFENAAFQFVGTHCKYFLVGGKRRNLFTMEGRWKGNGIPYSSVDEKQEVVVTILKDFNVAGDFQYI
jgi:hypothetical protein